MKIRTSVMKTVLLILALPYILLISIVGICKDVFGKTYYVEDKL